MITWERVKTPARHLYRCAHCGFNTMSMSRLVGTCIRAARIVRVSAFDCSRCGNQTCFDGDRQIPSYLPTYSTPVRGTTVAAHLDRHL